MSSPTHVLHLLYSFSTGGMENVVVQLINHLPSNEFRHTVIALTRADPAFLKRIGRGDVRIVELNKPPGHPFHLYPTVYRLLRKYKPDVLHTCNMAALEFMPVAALARVPLRIHAEHGWDVNDQGGANVGYQFLRRVYKHFVHQFIAVSGQLYAYLHDVIGVPEDKLNFIQNGVDTERFRPVREGDSIPEGWPFRRSEHFVIGTIGRLAPIKNQVLLAQSFVEVIRQNPQNADRFRLAIIGEGELAEPVRDILQKANLSERLWMPGNRSDIPEIMRALDCFILPSLSEATSCTLQEAMATSLHIVATNVGGNSDLLEGGRFGSLVPSGDVAALAKEIINCVEAGKLNSQVPAARESIQHRYGLASVMLRYRELFLNAF
jgi:sugar transferase (PEP-CTERM/EpsH1 system associated)